MNIKKTVSFFLIITYIMFLVVEPTILYAGYKSKAKAGVNDFIEGDLNINVADSLRPMLEGVNSMDKKGQTPKVSVRFSEHNPKVGEKITASADVVQVRNMDNAYYVWYLKRANGIDVGDDNFKYTYDNYTDAVGLHKNATKAAAVLYYDPEMFEQEFNDNIETKDDSDSYEPRMGGDDGTSNDYKHYCYIYDMEDGTQYEIGEASAAEGACPSGYVEKCMIGDRNLQCSTKIVPAIVVVGANASANASSSNTGGSSSSSATTGTEAGGGGGTRYRNLAVCKNTGIKPTCKNNVLSCASSVSSYDYSSENTKINTPYCVPKDSTGKVWKSPYESGCPVSEYSVCFAGEAFMPTKAEHEALCGVGSFNPSNDERPAYYGSSCYEDMEAGIIKQPGKCGIGSAENDCEKDFHTFDADAVKDMSVAVENEYGTNPYDPNTTGLADNDGKFIAGLGMKDFTWEYQPGDEVAVIVEGQGINATKHADATYQTVFAFSKDGCGALTSAGKYGITVNKKVIKIDTTKIDPEECLNEDMFEKPGISEFEALDVTISTGVNEKSSVPSGISKPMSVSAIAGGSKGGEIENSQNLYYEWEMTCDGGNINLLTYDPFTGTKKDSVAYKDKEDNNSTWEEENLNSKTKGMGVDTLDFKANFPSECFTDSRGKVEITARINQPREGGTSNFGKHTISFDVFDVEENPLRAYKTEIINDTQFKVTDTQICDEGTDKIMCRVMNNEVIAVTAYNGSEPYRGDMITWKIDDEQYVCDPKVSPDCTSTENSNTVYIPAQGSDGDLITVVATLNDVDATKNEQQTIVRVFRITEPSVFIVPESGAVWKALGTYTGFHNIQYLNESEDTMEAIKGKEITLSANLYPSFIQPNSTDNSTNTSSSNTTQSHEEGMKTTYKWFINDEIYSTEEKISFIPTDDASVSLKVERALGRKDRLALQDGLNINQTQTTSETFEKTVQINLIEDTLNQTAGIKGVFATVSHNAPDFILFTLKMTFIIGIMLFIPSLILGIGVRE